MNYLKTIFAAAGIAVSFSFASIASAATLGTLDIPFDPGLGNTNTDFVIATNDVEDIEIGIKAKAGFTGALPNDGINRFFAEAGSRTAQGFVEPGIATWNYDFSIDVGAGNLISDFDVFLTLDVNPAVGNTDFISFDFNALPDGAGGVLAPLDIQVFQGSQNLGFLNSAFPGIFDANAPGEYFLGLDVFVKNTTTSLASTSAFVEVAPVPLPAAGLMLLAGLGGMGLMRRRKTKQSA